MSSLPLGQELLPSPTLVEPQPRSLCLGERPSTLLLACWTWESLLIMWLLSWQSLLLWLQKLEISPILKITSGDLPPTNFWRLPRLPRWLSCWQWQQFHILFLLFVRPVLSTPQTLSFTLPAVPGCRCYSYLHFSHEGTEGDLPKVKQIATGWAEFGFR